MLIFWHLECVIGSLNFFVIFHEFGLFLISINLFTSYREFSKYLSTLQMFENLDQTTINEKKSFLYFTKISYQYHFIFQICCWLYIITSSLVLAISGIKKLKNHNIYCISHGKPFLSKTTEILKRFIKKIAVPKCQLSQVWLEIEKKYTSLFLFAVYNKYLLNVNVVTKYISWVNYLCL